MDIDTADQLLQWVDGARHRAGLELDETRQAELNQFFTPSSVASVMATMIRPRSGHVSVLDPGSGVGPLWVHAVVHLIESNSGITGIDVVAYELDEVFYEQAAEIAAVTASWSESRGVDLRYELRPRDFLADAASGSVASHTRHGFDIAILNPPYGKLRKGSPERAHSAACGVDVPNVYAAFMVASLSSLAPSGDLVAITPRSFCNGTYFRRFREWLLRTGSLTQIHAYDSRRDAFRDHTVLQETIITHLVKAESQAPQVRMTAQAGTTSPTRERTVPFARVVQVADEQSFIHVVPDADADRVAADMASYTNTVDDLGLTVSTGRVVDFRARDLLRHTPGPDDLPLLYPHNLQHGTVQWPRPGRGSKAQGMSRQASPAGLTVPNDGDYVLVKRFSSKEERRRVTASWLQRSGFPSVTEWGFENHLNYFHLDGGGFDADLAAGLTVFLNTTLVDEYLRQFSGHTQVNAGDLRSLRYPSKSELRLAGTLVSNAGDLTQSEIDTIAADTFVNADAAVAV